MSMRSSLLPAPWSGPHTLLCSSTFLLGPALPAALLSTDRHPGRMEELLGRSSAPPGAGWELGHNASCNLPPQPMAELITPGSASPWVDGAPVARPASPSRFPGVPSPAALSVCQMCCSTGAESPPLQRVLTGCCINDLGSYVAIRELQGNGTFNGTYLTAVSMTRRRS